MKFAKRNSKNLCKIPYTLDVHVLFMCVYVSCVFCSCLSLCSNFKIQFWAKCAACVYVWMICIVKICALPHWHRYTHTMFTECVRGVYLHKYAKAKVSNIQFTLYFSTHRIYMKRITICHALQLTAEAKLHHQFLVIAFLCQTIMEMQSRQSTKLGNSKVKLIFSLSFR